MKKAISLLCALALLAGLFVLPGAAAGTGSFYAVGGWFESIYAELSDVADADVTAVSYSGEMTGELKGDHLKYLVREVGDVLRIDIPGLRAGEYTLTVTTKSQTYTKTGIQVAAYDRSGYAHQVMDESTGVCTRYTEGVGAYNDDGTLKANAVVLYVTEETKDTVTLTATNSGKNFTVTGIGSILRYGSSANQQILKRLATNNKAPLVVRLVGTVTTPKDLSTPSFALDKNNQWDGDNAYMADMVSGANITIEGIGADAVMDGWGISFGVGSGDTAFGCGKNFEVRNLSFQNVPEDCVGIGGKSIDSDPVTHTWVHNCAFYVPHIPLLQSPNTSDKPYTWVNDKQQGDGAQDWKVAKYHTMSYNYFEGYHKTNLIGGSNSQKQYHATWHHNYWKNCESRGPLCRQTDIHIYNNLYDGNTSYCMSLRASCFVFSEYNTFLNCTNPFVQESADSTYGIGLCKSYQDVLTNCKGKQNATFVQDRATPVTHAQNYNPFINFDTTAGNYVAKGDYELDADVETAQANIKAYAGPMKAAEGIADSHTHIWSSWTPVAGQEATCTQAGQEKRTCSGADCPVGTQTRTVSALGHNYESGVCTRCGDKKIAKTYTLTGDEVYAAMEQSVPTGFTKNPSTGDSSGKNPNSYVAGSAVTGTAGTEDFFTLHYTSGTRIDPSAKTFDDGYAAQCRINFVNKAAKNQNAIQFETEGPVTVRVWWVSGAGKNTDGSDKPARSMVILNSAGSQVVKSAESSSSTETPMFSTLELTEAGTYYLGGDIGKNFIYKVTVTTEGAPAVEDPPGTGRLEGTDQTLLWAIDTDDATPSVSGDSTISITGDVGANQAVWVACWDADGNFVSAKCLTGIDPTARLPESWANVTLMWLDAGSGPKCREARETRQP